MKLIPYESRYKNQVIALILYLQNYDNQVDLSLEEQPDMNAIEDYYMVTGGNFWLVETDDGMVVGTIGLLVKEQVGVLKKFFVHQDFRGREKGVSALLYQALLADCQAKGVMAIVLDTPSKCYAAHRFYEKQGFKQIEKEELPVRYDYLDRDSLFFMLGLDK
ncbi:TPA: GNAT family N-acetyltransferase [Streptococcus suis]|nr:GNAT family N-acetyltransferase [Streptococcus suis]